MLTELRTQDALEWRVISGRLSPEQIHRDLVGSRERAESLIDRAVAHDPDGDGARLTMAHA